MYISILIIIELLFLNKMHNEHLPFHNAHFHYKRNQAWVHKFANPQRSKGDQSMFTHSKHKQITIINVFNKRAAVAADASLGLQICGPMPDFFYNGNVHYKMEGVNGVC